MNNHTNKWKWPLWSVLSVEISIPALVRKCWGRDALSWIWINMYWLDKGRWREGKSFQAIGMTCMEILKGGAARYGWGTERRPIWVKCRELGEHGQDAAEEMDQTMLGLKAMFRFWILSWNKWEATGGLQGGEWHGHMCSLRSHCTASWRMDYKSGVRMVWKTNYETNAAAKVRSWLLGPGSWLGRSWWG